MKQEQLAALAAQYKTPLYVFDTHALTRRVNMVRQAFSDAVRLCYSIKANSFLTGVVPVPLLEVCSPGELKICNALAVPPENILYSGVNKTQRCVQEAFAAGVRYMTAESPLQLQRIAAEAKRLDQAVEVLLRLSGGDQFGMDKDTLRGLIKTREQYERIHFAGLHYFSGTQKRNAKIIKRELSMLTDFADALENDFNFQTERLEYGAGLYAEYFSADAAQREEQLLEDVAPFVRNAASRFQLTVEMGRFFAASCGYYLTTVEDVKTTDGKRCAIVDGGIHQIHYDGLILAPAPPPVRVLGKTGESDQPWMVYGSLCSRGDILVQNARFAPLELGDVLCFSQAGAYAVTEGMALFLARDIPAVVLTDGGSNSRLVRGHMETAEMNTPHEEKICAAKAESEGFA